MCGATPITRASAAACKLRRPVSRQLEPRSVAAALQFGLGRYSPPRHGPAIRGERRCSFRPAYAQGAPDAAPAGSASMQLPAARPDLRRVLFPADPAAAEEDEGRISDMLAALRRGDRVVTGGGIIGTVTKVVNDDELQVEIAEGVRVRVLRSIDHRACVAKTEPAAARDDAEDERRSADKAEPTDADRRGRSSSRPRHSPSRGCDSAHACHFANWKIIADRWRSARSACICRLAQPVQPRAGSTQLPSWLPHKQISLGLDLHGGSYLLLEVDIDAVVQRAAQRRRRRACAARCARPRSAIPASASTATRSRSRCATRPQSRTRASCCARSTPA